MKQVVYIDILVGVNFIVNYFLILITCKLLCLKLEKIRLVLGEILSGVFSLYIFLPDLPIYISFFIKIAMASIIVLIVFKIKSFKVFIKGVVYFYIVSFLFSGIMFFLWYSFTPKGMVINNGIVYFNISPKILIFSTLVAYFTIEFLSRILDKKKNKNFTYEVFLKIGDKKFNFAAELDTCNNLKEPFSNLPVIVVEKEIFSIQSKFDSFFEDDFLNYLRENLNIKIRFIPFQTVSGGGIMPAFKPDILKINNGENKNGYIAICDKGVLISETQALMNPLLVD